MARLNRFERRLRARQEARIAASGGQVGGKRRRRGRRVTAVDLPGCEMRPDWKRTPRADVRNKIQAGEFPR